MNFPLYLIESGINDAPQGDGNLLSVEVDGELEEIANTP